MLARCIDRLSAGPPVRNPYGTGHAWASPDLIAVDIQNFVHKAATGSQLAQHSFIRFIRNAVARSMSSTYSNL